MPLQNRVTPFSTIQATHHRGLFMGNRGCLHNGSKQLVATRRGEKRWIICELAFKGQRRELMRPGHYTELFFLDEAVALAAGHRPCSLCRRGAFNDYRAAWKLATGDTALAPEIDAILDGQRTTQIDDCQPTYATVETLPNGTFVVRQDAPDQAWLVNESALRRWNHAGYVAATPLVPGEVVWVLTPPAHVALLRHAYLPRLHPSAGDERPRIFDPGIS